MPRLKVVALISGGKDSLFSILHCQANGHDVIALANLHPPLDAEDGAQEDMDSFMYQTVGHRVVSLYEQALGLPLYRQAIQGTAVDQNKSYAAAYAMNSALQDETESLVPLLKKVLNAHPEVNAVSTGAILSDYQRTRVESVALRLGLTPLSYLWQYSTLPPQTELSLLEDMAAVGQDARIIKVASGGLDETFLWRNVADAQTITCLTKASQRFGSVGDGAVLGEGGEYETLAIDGPSSLWRKRIVVEEMDRFVVPGNAGTASLRIAKAYIAPKEDYTPEEAAVRIPRLLDDRFQLLLDICQRLRTATIPAEDREPLKCSPTWQCETENNLLCILNAVAPGYDAGIQMRSIMEGLELRLTEHGHASPEVAFVTISLRNMGDFPIINTIYRSYFTAPNPPARVTIARGCALDSGCLVLLSAISFKQQETAWRNSLHVQSQSYWAPANIGPYSQAISVPLDFMGETVVYVAGQIPLVPASMELAPVRDLGKNEAFCFEAVLSLQHLHRIGNVMRVRRWAVGVAFVTADSTQDLAARFAVVRAVWEGFHQRTASVDPEEEQDDAFDVWKLQKRGDFHVERLEEQDSKSDGITGRVTPELFLVEVKALPRGARIEWASLGLSTTESGYESMANKAVDRYLRILGINLA